VSDEQRPLDPNEIGMLQFVTEGLKARAGMASRIVMPGTLGALFDRDPRFTGMLKARTIDANPYAGGHIVDAVTFCESPEYLNIKLKPKQAEILWKFNHEKDKATGEAMWKEFVGMVGMRSGKTVMGSCQEAYELYCLLMLDDPAAHYNLVPGQEIYLINVAASETQSKDTVFAQLRSRVENSPWFQKYIAYLKSFGRVRRGDFLFRELENRLEFNDKHIVCLSMNSNSLTNVGKTAKFVIFDELAKFKTTEGKDSADEVYSSISRATQTFGWSGHVWSISSPLNDDDKIVELAATARKGEVKGMLGYVLPTWEFNPSITRASLDREYLKDPILADRDFGCVPPRSHQDFIADPDALKAFIYRGLRPVFSAQRKVVMKPSPNGDLKAYVHLDPDFELPRERKFSYHGHGDPGHTDDSFCFGVSHLEIRQRQDRTTIINYPVVVQDLLLEWKPDPSKQEVVDFLDVKETIKYIHDHIGLTRVTFDRWNSAMLIQELLDFGINAEDLKFTDQGQFEHYMTLKRLIACGQFESFLGDEATFEQYKNLQIVNGTRIDHKKRGKVTDKDRSDCWAAGAYFLTKDLFDEGSMLNYQQQAVGKKVALGGLRTQSRLGGVPSYVSTNQQLVR